MRGLRVLILICATVSAMAAMWMMRSALQSQANLPTPEQQLAAAQPAENPVEEPVTSQVLVANRDIPTGRVLGPEDLRWQAWPEDSVSENFYTEGEDVDAIETLTGSASRLVIVEGEPITSNKIVDLNGTGVLAALLRPGMRAISIPISEITGAGGFILPGDFVDILLTRQVLIEEIDEETGEVERSAKLNQTDTIMKTVRVLAIDQQLNESVNAASVGNSATMELTPEQAELITLTRQMAQQDRGFLTLSLRSFKEMIDEYGDDIDKVLPVTVLDLRTLVAERMKAADDSRNNYMKRARKRSAKAKIEAERAEAEAALEAEKLAKAAAAASSVAGSTTQAAGPTADTPAPPSTVTLIRNGRPIVVHTITPNSAGSQ